MCPRAEAARGSTSTCGPWGAASAPAGGPQEPADTWPCAGLAAHCNPLFPGRKRRPAVTQPSSLRGAGVGVGVGGRAATTGFKLSSPFRSTGPLSRTRDHAPPGREGSPWGRSEDAGLRGRSRPRAQAQARRALPALLRLRPAPPRGCCGWAAG